MTWGLFVSNQFQEKKFVHQEDLKFLVCYICSCLKSNFGESQKFWFDMFAYYLKVNDVCKWRQKNGYLLVAKWGESICEDKTVTIF